MKMTHFAKASAALLATMTAACSSNWDVASKQTLIDRYAATKPLSAKDASIAHGDITAAARAQCHPHGPRRGNVAGYRRMCIARFTNDVVRRVDDRQLFAASETLD